MAPEVLLHQRLTRAADVYSYGILVRFGDCGGGGGLRGEGRRVPSACRRQAGGKLHSLCTLRPPSMHACAHACACVPPRPCAHHAVPRECRVAGVQLGEVRLQQRRQLLGVTLVVGVHGGSKVTL